MFKRFACHLSLRSARTWLATLYTANTEPPQLGLLLGTRNLPTGPDFLPLSAVTQVALELQSLTALVYKV